MIFNDFPSTTPKALVAELRRRASVGKEGAIWVRRDSESGTLQLHAGAKSFPVLRLQVQLCGDTGVHHITETDFRGELLLDDRGEQDEMVRLALLDDLGQTVLTSSNSVLVGNIYIVAVQDTEKQIPLCYSALFDTKADGSGRSAVMWGTLREWLYFSDLLGELLGGGDDGAC